MRKILLLFCKGQNRSSRLSSRLIAIISQRLISLSGFVPLEFQRKPRTLAEIERWKATEFRQFLLYIGPLVLKGVLQKEFYDHFMLFHSAILILCHPQLYATHNDSADFLLTKFVEEFPSLFGRESLSYNVHGLLHLSEDSARFGPLDEYATFKFENNFQYMKKLVRTYRLAIQQISNRLAEEALIPSKIPNKIFPELKMVHADGPLPEEFIGEQYKMLITKSFTIRLRPADSVVVLQSGKIVRIENILKTEEQVFVIGPSFKKCEAFDTRPCDASAFGINVVTKHMSRIRSWPLSEVKMKCVALPFKEEKTVVFPLLHNHQE